MATVTINSGPNIGQEWTVTDQEGRVLYCSYADAVIWNLEPGAYSIRWGAVEGYELPVPETEGPVMMGEDDAHTFVTPVYKKIVERRIEINLVPREEAI